VPRSLRIFIPGKTVKSMIDDFREPVFQEEQSPYRRLYRFEYGPGRFLTSDTFERGRYGGTGFRASGSIHLRRPRQSVALHRNYVSVISPEGRSPHRPLCRFKKGQDGAWPSCVWTDHVLKFNRRNDRIIRRVSYSKVKRIPR